MIAIIALAATLPTQPVHEAERAFAAQAQREGRWKAFRDNSTADAIMLAPGIVNAHRLLAPLKEPAQAVQWWPARSVTSCDGKLAFSTGLYLQPDGQGGQFFTIWQRQADGRWKWVYDGGTSGPGPYREPATIDARQASCGGVAPAFLGQGSKGGGASPDGSLRWRLDPGPIGKSYLLRVDYRLNDRWQVATATIVGG